MCVSAWCCVVEDKRNKEGMYNRVDLKSIEQNCSRLEKKFPFPLSDPFSVPFSSPSGSGGLLLVCSSLKAPELIS